MRLRRRHGEEGSSLILALVFLSLFGVFIAALLSFAETSFRATIAVRSQGGVVYASDGAVDGAINAIRGMVAAGRDPTYGGTCSDFTLPGVNGETVTVQCEGQSGSGAPSGEQNTSLNKPKRAIVTLARGTEDGIVQGSNSAITVHGPVSSNSTIKLNSSGASMTVEGNVSATGSCAGTITSTTGSKTCNLGTVPPDGTDPGYAPETTTIPASRSVPACPGGTAWLVSFSPGTYTDAQTLSDRMKGSGSGSCPGKVFHFQPGNYYFAFTGSNHVWTVSDANANVVGGTPKSWDTGAVTRPSVPAPGGCDTRQPGVQFIFAGDSRLSVDAGKFELCANPNLVEQRIAIYQSPGAAQSGPTSLKPTGSSNVSGDVAFSNPGGAFTIGDSSVATASFASANPGPTPGIRLTGFDQVTVPSGATINAATLRVVHQESATNAFDKLRATVTGGAGFSTTITEPNGSCDTSVELCKHTGLLEDKVDLLARGLDSPDEFATLNVTYEAPAKNNRAGTETLDGVYMDVTYTPPGSGFAAPSGCILVSPYPGSSACPLVKTDGSQTTFALQGTLYAPSAPVDINLPNQLSQTLGRGVISRVFIIGVPASSSSSGPAIQNPDDSPLADRTVRFTAYVGGVARLRALVKFEDGGGATPGQTVRILSWSVLR